MNNLKEVLRPKTLSEFSKIYKKNSYLMAGSTYSFKSIENNNEIKELIIIDSLPLKYIKKDKNSVRLGSLSTFYDLENNEITKKHFFGFISHAASFCSSQLIRNMATFGGNIAHPNAFNILPLIVETLNGKIKIYDGKKYYTLSLGAYYSKKIPGLITEIILPLKYDKNVFYFEKIARTNSSWESYITFSFRTGLLKNKITDLRMVFGALTHIPLYNAQIEKEVIGKSVKELDIDYVAKRYSDFVYSVNPSHKYSDYRKEVVYNTVKEFLNKLSKR